MFSAWTDASIAITKDYFMHIYPWKDNRMEESIKNSGKAGAAKADKNKKGIAFDWSKPSYTINLNNIKSVEMKKEDLKLIITQSKSKFVPTKPDKK